MSAKETFSLNSRSMGEIILYASLEACLPSFILKADFLIFLERVTKLPFPSSSLEDADWELRLGRAWWYSLSIGNEDKGITFSRSGAGQHPSEPEEVGVGVEDFEGNIRPQMVIEASFFFFSLGSQLPRGFFFFNISSLLKEAFIAKIQKKRSTVSQRGRIQKKKEKWQNKIE